MDTQIFICNQVTNYGGGISLVTFGEMLPEGAPKGTTRLGMANIICQTEGCMFEPDGKYTLTFKKVED